MSYLARVFITAALFLAAASARAADPAAAPPAWSDQEKQAFASSCTTSLGEIGKRIPGACACATQQVQKLGTARDLEAAQKAKSPLAGRIQGVVMSCLDKDTAGYDRLVAAEQDRCLAKAPPPACECMMRHLKARYPRASAFVTALAPEHAAERDAEAKKWAEECKAEQGAAKK